ncbi:hypothetical protein F2Q70_00021061 [Brassica cretica]|uniref:Uncharacterized protein n=2 Tax=Brassica cretica TaxID=69181 RepID=A0A3N6RPE7_BRACR|nr:hypothetical protein F2Q70_00021061 [Brassica cretica]KAF2554549.1 hypothetical protein F2Q68_00014544 [Brassica cretica]KAF3605606.1 hypothetical protein DY000_02047048 [Brassica cretica]
METTYADPEIKMAKRKNSKDHSGNGVAVAATERPVTPGHKPGGGKLDDPDNDFETKSDSKPTNHALAISHDIKGNIPCKETASPVREQNSVTSILHLLFAGENLHDELSQTNEPGYPDRPEEPFIEVQQDEHCIIYKVDILHPPVRNPDILRGMRNIPFSKEIRKYVIHNPRAEIPTYDGKTDPKH